MPLARLFILFSMGWLAPLFAVGAEIDGLYVNAFGSERGQPVIFIHGGPGFHSRDFEATTAEPLARLGYYVVTYDQRGQGRSRPVDRVGYTYARYAQDLLKIIAELKLKNPVLIGHSHGGPIAIRFDELHPGVAKAVVLASSPVDFWSAFEAIFENCSARYRVAGHLQALGDLTNSFGQVAAVRRGSEAIVGPVARFFQHALFGCGLYAAARPTARARELRRIAEENPAPMDENSMPGFLVNESYIYRDGFSHLRSQKGRYFGIYGDEDGLFTETSRDAIADALSDSNKRRFFLIRGSSHAVYLDRQSEFLGLVDQILKGL